MYTVLLVETTYSRALRLQRMIDWEALGFSLIVEYEDASGFEKLRTLKPDILMLDTLLYMGTDEYIAEAKRCNRRAQAIILNDTVGGQLFPADTHLLRLDSTSAPELSELLLSIQRRFERDTEKGVQMQQTPAETEYCGEKLSRLLEQKISAGDHLYLLRARFRAITRPIDAPDLEHELHNILEDFFAGWFWESETVLCVIIREDPNVSILYSIKVLETMVLAVCRMLFTYGECIQPVLFSSRTDTAHVLRDYQMLYHLEKAAYFCPARIVLTPEQVQSIRRPFDYILANELLSGLLSHLLTGNQTGALHTIDRIYNEALKPSMDLAALSYCRERIQYSFDLLASYLQKQQGELAIQFERLPTIDEERYLVRNFILEHCNFANRCQPAHSRVLQSLQMVEKEFQNDLSLESIAEVLELSPSYFSKLFKENLGLGFIEYLHRVRIFHAKEFIATGITNVGSLTRLCGFSDPKYFSRVFKKQTGLSPSQYIEQVQGDSPQR